MRKYLFALVLAAGMIGSLGSYIFSVGTATHAAACGDNNNC